jgi:hypothetical protein
VPEIRVTGLPGCGHDGLVNGSEDRELAGALADAVTDPAPARTALVMARLAGLPATGS